MPTKDPDKRRARRAQRKEELQAYMKPWRHEHRQHVRQSDQQYKKEHREHINARERKKRQDNPETVRARERRNNPKRMAWRRADEAANPEKYKAKRRLYNAQPAVKEKARHLAQRYRDAHPEVIKANYPRVAQYYRDHPELSRAKVAKRNAIKRGAVIHDFTARPWERMKIWCAHRCCYCDRQMERLTQEHLTPVTKGGNHTLWNILPACRSCNAKKKTGPVLCPVQPFLLL